MQSNKLKELRNYSDPEYVMSKAKMMGLNPVHESSRKDKKNTWCLMAVRWFTSDRWDMKMQLNIMI